MPSANNTQQAESLENAGNALFKSGDYAAAVGKYKEAVVADPDNFLLGTRFIQSYWLQVASGTTSYESWSRKLGLHDIDKHDDRLDGFSARSFFPTLFHAAKRTPGSAPKPI